MPSHSWLSSFTFVSDNLNISPNIRCQLAVSSYLFFRSHLSGLRQVGSFTKEKIVLWPWFILGIPLTACFPDACGQLFPRLWPGKTHIVFAPPKLTRATNTRYQPITVLLQVLIMHYFESACTNNDKLYDWSRLCIQFILSSNRSCEADTIAIVAIESSFECLCGKCNKWTWEPLQPQITIYFGSKMKHLC